MKLVVAVVKIAFYDETAPKLPVDTTARLAAALDTLDGEVIDVEVTIAQDVNIPDPDLEQHPLSWAVGSWRRDARRIAAETENYRTCRRACRAGVD